jgi:hypothetical protein
MMDFISHNVLMSLGILFLIIMFLSGKITGLIVRGFIIVFIFMIVMSMGMAFLQKGSSALHSLTTDNVARWLADEFGSVGGKIISGLFGASSNMQEGYRSCLYDALQNSPQNRGSGTLVTALKRVCPNATPTNPDATWEACLTTVLSEYEPTAVTSCQQKYQGPAGLTHSTVNQTRFCKYFSSLCSATK